jgi:molybdopterin converting factor small subunit
MTQAASIRILFFGRPADRFGGQRTLEGPEDGLTMSELRRRIATTADGGDILLDPAIRGAVDGAECGDDAWVRPGQEAAFFSIFSGG